MQGDKNVLNFSKLLKKNKKMKDSKFSKSKIGWHNEPFIFPKTTEVDKNSYGESISIVRIVQFYKSLSHNYRKTLHSHLCSERKNFQLEKQSTLDNISELEKQLLDFQQKHTILQGELLDAKKELKLLR